MTVRLVRVQAKKLAEEFWDADRSDRFRALFPDVKEFVGRLWPDFVIMARSVLTDMLSRNDVAQYLKDEIYEALVEDNKRAVKAGTHDKGRMLLKAAHPGPIEQKITKNLKELN